MVGLADTMERIAWVLMIRKEVYRAKGLLIGAVDRNSGLMLCRRSGGTTCPPVSQTARRRKHSILRGYVEEL